MMLVTMLGMIRCMIMALVALLTPCVQGGGVFLVHVASTEGAAPEGTYLLVQGNEGLVSLQPISGSKELRDVKVEQMVPALERAYPDLIGKVRVTEVKADAGKLAKAGKVHVMGQVDHQGDLPAGSLSECINSAKPTVFGAVTRIEVIRGRNRYVCNLRKKDHAEAKLEPGDIVFVPKKIVIGL
ncbi:hypothetical protein [Luteolibacter soli]|uniref:Soluble ligand binding domain-containing protein n=1 Tax=Luteolibacter soli TaxID=3135280 RepID=A0ABU9ASI9_9BACT